MNDNNALEALKDLITAMKAECGEGKWFPDWVPNATYDGKFTRRNYMDAIEQVRSALVELAEIKKRAEEEIDFAITVIKGEIEYESGRAKDFDSPLFPASFFWTHQGAVNALKSVLAKISVLKGEPK